jgi:hypothetical protein
MVRPTMSGMMVESRDHVLMMRFSVVLVAAETFLASDASMYGPFLTDRDMSLSNS